MRKLSLFLLLSAFGCSSSPKNITITDDLLTRKSSSFAELETFLTLGENQLSAGYSTEATLYTEKLIEVEEMEKGKRNLDSEEKIKAAIEQRKLFYTKNKTCFYIRVHTYYLERSSFRNWVAKLRDSSGKIFDVNINNTTGVNSVPSAYKDIHGRTWHNGSFACTNEPVSLVGKIELILIPQIINNQGQDETTTLTWLFN